MSEQTEPESSKAKVTKSELGPLQSRAGTIAIYLAILLGTFYLLDRFVVQASGRVEIRYDAFVKMVEDGKVKSVDVNDQELSGELKKELPLEVAPGKTLPRKRFRVLRVRSHEKLIELLIAKGVEVTGEPDSSALTQVLVWGVLIALMLGGWFIILKKLSPQSQVMSFGRSRAKVVAESELEVRFKDVAGIDEAKDELEELILFLKQPERFQRLGARIPRGVLLVGSPGTGKTMLAKAVAGEAQVPFYSLSGSDFVEMFAGVGASRVRDLFEQAQGNAPCIVFIDELDAIGKVRGIGFSGAHDEREQTLNQLLSEMDGFDSQNGVIILSATNRPEVLDPALLRPGRFDRQIVVDRPDLRGRQEILEVHGAKVILGEDIDLPAVARQTPGFVGADLANLVNEAALLAARRDQDAVTMPNFDEALQRVIAGLEKRRRVIRPEEKRRIAVHESGHALVAVLSEYADPVHRVSIVSRGVAALGYTMQLPVEERYLMTRRELEDRLDVLLGGRCAERVVLGSVSTGASDDLRRALSLARRMVMEFGMSEGFGAVAFADETRSSFLDGSGNEASKPRTYSEETARELDIELRGIIDGAEKRVLGLLEKHLPALDAVSTALLEHETLLEEELLRIAGAAGATRGSQPAEAMGETPKVSGEELGSLANESEEV